MTASFRPRRPRGGFTLVEVLVAAGITGMTLALLMPFFVFSIRSLFHGEQKLLINGDIRAFTTEMTENARESNYFVLYQSFYDRTAGGAPVSRDANGDGLVNELDRQLAGATGDFLVLVFTRNNATYDSRFYDGIQGNEPPNVTQVTRVVGYWIAPNRNPAAQGQPANRSALYTFDTDDFKSSPGAATWTTTWGVEFPVVLGASTTLENLLPPATSTAATSASYAEILINDVEGRAARGLNFVNFGNKTAVMQSRILHGNRAKRVTNTYNFAITPRG